MLWKWLCSGVRSFKLCRPTCHLTLSHWGGRYMEVLGKRVTARGKRKRKETLHLPVTLWSQWREIRKSLSQRNNLTQFPLQVWPSLLIEKEAGTLHGGKEFPIPDATKFQLECLCWFIQDTLFLCNYCEGLRDPQCRHTCIYHGKDQKPIHYNEIIAINGGWTNLLCAFTWCLTLVNFDMRRPWPITRCSDSAELCRNRDTRRPQNDPIISVVSYLQVS